MSNFLRLLFSLSIIFKVGKSVDTVRLADMAVSYTTAFGGALTKTIRDVPDWQFVHRNPRDGNTVVDAEDWVYAHITKFLDRQNIGYTDDVDRYTLNKKAVEDVPIRYQYEVFFPSEKVREYCNKNGKASMPSQQPCPSGWSKEDCDDLEIMFEDKQCTFTQLSEFDHYGKN